MSIVQRDNYVTSKVCSTLYILFTVLISNANGEHVRKGSWRITNHRGLMHFFFNFKFWPPKHLLVPIRPSSSSSLVVHFFRQFTWLKSSFVKTEWDRFGRLQSVSSRGKYSSENEKTIPQCLSAHCGRIFIPDFFFNHKSCLNFSSMRRIMLTRKVFWFLW